MDENEKAKFDAFLKDFMIKVDIACCLESSGKITPHKAYADIKSLWKSLKKTKKQYNIKDEEKEAETGQDSEIL